MDSAARVPMMDCAMGEALFHALFVLCHALSWPLALLHALLAAARIVHLPEAVALSRNPRFAALRRCWFTKCARELVPMLLASPMRREAMERVRFGPPAGCGDGCVYATLRSPWLKLLSACCREQRAGRVLVRGGKSRSWSETAIAADRAGLRAMIEGLRRGEPVFVAMEAFVDRDGCAVRFLGARREASLLPARLAAAARVPLIATMPVMRGSNVEFIFSPARRVQHRQEDGATREAMQWLEARVLEEPSIWNETLRFWVGILRRSEPRREEASVDPDRLAGDERSGR